MNFLSCLKVWLLDELDCDFKNKHMAKVGKFEEAVDAVQKSMKLFKLKPEQKTAIGHLISEKHTFYLLPTGYGKSAIYGILPLIKDQVGQIPLWL